MKSKVLQNLSVFLMLVVIHTSLIAMSEGDHLFHPGELWLDTDGQPINAHGGGVLQHGDTYYWFGEIKLGDTYLPACNADWDGTRIDANGVSCYSSKDLVHWTNEGIALSAVTEPADHDLHVSKVIERPKVIYNEKTKKFVMWMHVDSKDYKAARSGVAISDTPTGPYQYLRSYRPNSGVWPSDSEAIKKNAGVDDESFIRDFHIGQMARDMTLYVDDDGTAYHLYASEENQTLHISKLTEDFLWHSGEYSRNFIGRSMEAPAIFKRDGKYYLFASGCTGWDPNAARSAVADSIMGPWKELGNPCLGEGKDITFNSQSSFVIRVQGKNERYIFMADRWNKDDLMDSRYVWLPVHFDAAGFPCIEWRDSWSL